jgi:hypothetical protein
VKSIAVSAVSLALSVVIAADKRAPSLDHDDEEVGFITWVEGKGQAALEAWGEGPCSYILSPKACSPSGRR